MRTAGHLSLGGPHLTLEKYFVSAAGVRSCPHALVRYFFNLFGDHLCRAGGHGDSDTDHFSVHRKDRRSSAAGYFCQPLHLGAMGQRRLADGMAGSGRRRRWSGVLSARVLPRAPRVEGKERPDPHRCPGADSRAVPQPALPDGADTGRLGFRASATGGNIFVSARRVAREATGVSLLRVGEPISGAGIATG